MAEEIYKKHQIAISTWYDFVLTSRQRGMSDNEIANKLRGNNVDEEAIQVLLSPVPDWRMRSGRERKGGWKIALGIFKILAGIFFLLFGNIVFGGVLVAGGIVWIGSYMQSGE